MKTINFEAIVCGLLVYCILAHLKYSRCKHRGALGLLRADVQDLPQLKCGPFSLFGEVLMIIFSSACKVLNKAGQFL
jgi:hypothetical protein